MHRLIRAAMVAALATFILPEGARAQQPAARCGVLPDTVAGPSPQQIAERTELRDRIAEALRGHGAAPAGLVMVDVNAERRGKLLFIQGQMPDSARAAALSLVGEYLATLQAGRAYQALIRIDGDYPALTPGRTHCRPELANGDSMGVWMQRVMEHHPESGRHPDEALVKRAVVRMVVARTGEVAFVEMDTPSGDEMIDANAEAIAARLRFRPATLDGVPFDVRFRFTLTFQIR
ncbi:TonB family protein [Longimicrobium sp.]|uniref:TonB family protein n=1 Tax=Longimicrobium sp. TaxID=2029185 RepID=UPI002E37B1F8|nr:TonB family protein [Longimicrobium sp.]HEX6039756.1 TonB family protein [Longimicrobium sp.]